jgi:para-aminobenzoate N-oxygenase AurF
MKTYSYQDCLNTAYRVNWRIDELVGGKNFDLSKNWLPSRLSAATSVSCLNEAEKRKLSHVEMGSYAHLFGYVEEFIAPKMVKLANEHEPVQPVAFQALTNFASEEVKHMTLFHRLRQMVNETLGTELRLLDGERDVAHFVLGKNEGAVLLLIASIEWFTQHHYLAAIKADDNLDPLTKEIFRAHWVEESQHAKMDHNEALQAFTKMTEEEKDLAVSDLIVLVKAVDGLLQKQSGYDVENLSRYLGRIFSENEKQELYQEILRTKRWVFNESGVTHPNFVELFEYVTTPSQRQRVGKALAA